jgi:hypothetical protein
MSHIHWVTRQNKLEIPKDKDEVCTSDFCKRVVFGDLLLHLLSELFAERICDITYPISSSPYYSEDIHTKITLGITQRSHDPRII